MSKIAPELPANGRSQLQVSGEIPVPVLINWLSISAVPLLAFFASRSVEQGEHLAAGLLIAFAILMTINLLIYAAFRHKTFQRRAFIGLTTTVFIYVSVSALENGSAIIWLFAYPPIIFYISDARFGVGACLFGFTGVTLLFFSPLADQLLNLPYSTSFRITMVVALGFEMITCYILDQSRRRSKLGLLALAREFEYAAKHDTLTGLANRREALAQLEVEYERYLRTNRPFAVLLADIDLFKSVNDTHGHHVGDELIVLVANTLHEEARKLDTTARWGGEEYLVLLPETNADGAVQIANRIREAIAEKAVMVAQTAVHCTASIGVASIEGAESVDKLLQHADEALYRAKALGRNRVCMYQIDGPA
ncbi:MULTISPECIES: GGDEF domain-containing protein [Marinobacter]|uniref:diguanylate cyclase n=1 Tax=Marinobacter xiaoshiensis TaxID=3073652 RepID=A0ABU2HLG5_9GAMM|nr:MULTISPECIES: GGDEF domain-containing protein [unclassified Marinobacter]MBK1872935.1 GGDEF domain-containing protein [Marinobacter sp. 1-3A]MDS1311902.1 GGDEF domain-containing protein [Marinobacter sp. F60267]